MLLRLSTYSFARLGCFCRTVAVSSSLPSSRLVASWSYRRSLSLSGRPVVVTAVVVSLSFRSLCALLFLLRCCRSANSVCVTLCWYRRPAVVPSCKNAQAFLLRCCRRLIASSFVHLFVCSLVCFFVYLLGRLFVCWLLRLIAYSFVRLHA